MWPFTVMLISYSHGLAFSISMFFVVLTDLNQTNRQYILPSPLMMMMIGNQTRL
jgi:hypothetical protein